MIHRFSVGRLTCAVISDGQPEPPWEPRLDSFFTPEGGVPAAELSRALAADGSNRTTLTCGYNCLLAQTPDGLAVIDTGLGARFLGYGPQFEPLVGRLGGRLAAAGFEVSDPSAVAFTHLHQDHSRGAIWSGEPTFPAAAGLAHAAEVAFWTSADSEAATEHRPTALAAIALFGERMRPFEYGEEILPGIRAVDAAGHTPGHTAFLLESAGERLLCLGDSFYDALQLRNPGFGTPWDTDLAAAASSRRRLLSWAADERMLVHGYHLPFPGLGEITRLADAFAWRPVSSS